MTGKSRKKAQESYYSFALQAQSSLQVPVPVRDRHRFYFSFFLFFLDPDPTCGSRRPSLIRVRIRNTVNGPGRVFCKRFKTNLSSTGTHHHRPNCISAQIQSNISSDCLSANQCTASVRTSNQRQALIIRRPMRCAASVDVQSEISPQLNIRQPISKHCAASVLTSNQ